MGRARTSGKGNPGRESEQSVTIIGAKGQAKGVDFSPPSLIIPGIMAYPTIRHISITPRTVFYARHRTPSE